MVRWTRWGRDTMGLLEVEVDTYGTDQPQVCAFLARSCDGLRSHQSLSSQGVELSSKNGVKMNKVKAFIVGLYSRFIRYLASTELTRAYADMWGRVAAEKKLADDLTNKVFGLERIKEALLEENKKLADGYNRL